jgi:hypothetical protein
MPILYYKLKDCGCLIETICWGLDKQNMYMLGGHKYIKKCNKCDEDRLYNMWKCDNVTDAYGFNGWKKGIK